MPRKMPFLLAALPVLLATSACFGLSALPTQDDDVPIWGIWARGNTVLLFAHVRECEDAGGGYKPAQTLVSTDSGRTWAMKGPRLIGRSFQYILNVGDEIWVAGDSYAEGPASDSFLLLVDPERDDWPEFQIYDGNEEFRALAHDERNPNRFFAWLDHVEMDEPEASHIFLHESLDRGRTWTAVKEVKRVPKSLPGLRFFQDIPMESGDWRIDPTTRTLEHRNEKDEWHTAAHLPLPIQNICPN